MPRSSTQIRAWVVIPTFNEADDIQRLCRALCELPPVVQIQVVDDASPDGTADLAAALSKEIPVSVLRRSAKDGRGGAVLDGFAQGLREPGITHFVEMDADFSHDPRELPTLFESALDHDIVIGSRYLPTSRISDWPFRRRAFSFLANRFARWMLRVPVRDYTNGYRCYSRQAMEALDRDQIEPKGFIALSAILLDLYQKGFSVTEVPTHFVNRIRGVSNFSRREILEAFQNILRLRKARVARGSHP